ncbi:MAG TPA: phosphatase domain-containing protein [Dermatophilaceae bacterium]|nr:phosphatase domain-containing protein [Dermatophilaceae bacterium]
MSRPHSAAIVEDAFHRRTNALLHRRGWITRTIGHTGYGSPEFVRVLGRVLLSRPPGEGRPEDAEDALQARVRELRGPDEPRGWRAFITAPTMGLPVTVTAGEREVRTRTDRSGYVDVVVTGSGLPAGWHEVTIAAEGAEPVRVPVWVVGTDVTFGLVSDIDDTVMITALPRPMIAAWNTFVRHETARHVVPGMAPMYRTLLAEHEGAPIFYVSTGAWNTAPTLTRFLARHGYPAGPLLLTDWGPTNTGWFRSGQEHKREALHRLAREFPHIRWTLVGDDGQHDPKIYGDFARDRPDVVDTIAIRELTPAEQVLSHGLPVSNEEFGPRPRRTVPVVRGPDGYVLLRLLRAAVA